MAEPGMDEYRELLDAGGFCFPGPIREREAERLAFRREALHSEDSSFDRLGPVVGCGLSGGGIRSATFCLGVFQALARHGRLGRIDYLSTVSGGGYFGGAFAALFARQPTTPKDVEKSLGGHLGGGDGKESTFVGNLRENGRYLSPNGSGDLLLGSAVILRNWVAVQVVLLSLLITFFLAAQIVAAVAHRWTDKLATPVALADWSLWWVAAGALLAIAALPAGWAYWFAGRQSGLPAVTGGLVALLAGIVLIKPGLAPSWLAAGEHPIRGWIILVISLEALTLWTVALLRGRRLDEVARELEHLRFLSAAIKYALLATGIIAALALIDSSAHLVDRWLSRASFGGWISGGSLVGVLTTLAVYSRRIVVMFGQGKEGNGRPRVSVSVAAAVAGTALVFGLGVASDLVALRLAVPSEGRAATMPAEMAESATLLTAQFPEGRLAVDVRLRAEPETPVAKIDAAQLRPPWLPFWIGVGLTILFGHSWSFLNRSSHQSLYSARLTRAYLGASNPARKPGASLSDVLPGDAPELGRYFSAQAAKNGAPIHLINVTVNETVDGKNKVQQQDRKGVGLALGPAGFHLGPERHLAMSWPDDSPAEGVGGSASEPPAWRVFREGRGRIESLSLGSWIGISGAAFTTGTGYRTSLGLSLLAGFANVRLGYWWSPGVRSAPDISRVEKAVFTLLPIHSYLLSEFFARFPGTALGRWYLSDGGHFENLGGYELIRRRLKRIVLIDAECDEGYSFGGLANFIRKARIDFGTEIQFWDAARLKTELRVTADGDGKSPRVRERNPCFPLGTLAELRRDGSAGVSDAYAAVADIVYPGGSTNGRLLYIKPAVCGTETTDISNYQALHKAFPHESTGDQFFDEAQWESYRKLGQLIGERIVGTPGGFAPMSAVGF